jgi:dUTP pyrophosphatase
MEVVKIYLKEGAIMPMKQTRLSAGYDIYACLNENIMIMPHERSLIPTGIKMQLPEGVEAQIRPRSGLALKHGITVLNSPGTIDADYRGEVGVILMNHGEEPFVVHNHDRIAQMVIVKTHDVSMISVDSESMLDSSERGEGGFGHTGK